MGIYDSNGRVHGKGVRRWRRGGGAEEAAGVASRPLNLAPAAGVPICKTGR